MWRVAVPILVLGATLATATLPRVDATRSVRAVDDALLFVPQAGQLRASASGFEEALSDLFWVRTVIVFGERFGNTSGTVWVTWLERMIAAVYTLDPLWRTPYFYGGTLLRASGEIDGSDQVFAAGREHIVDDAFFPFSLGMNAYIYRDDPATAAVYLAEAAQKRNAPTWYAAAAAAMQQHSGERRAGILYLRSIRESTTDPGVIVDTDRQLARLYHNEAVDTWADACRAWKRAHGPLGSPEELARLGYTLPENPRGDAWIVGADGVVRSEGAEAERYRRALGDEWQLVRE